MNHPLRLAGLGAAALVLVGSVTTFLVVRGADAATETLLSQGRPATASSVETASLGAAQAFDGNGGTRWGSLEGVDPQWIRVDLGATYAVTHVNLSWEAAYGTAYRIQTSPDGSAWTDIYSTTSGNGGTDDLTGLTGTGRYVRLYGTTRATQWGYSLWEFKVYGNPAATPSPSVTASASPSTSPSPSRSASASASPSRTTSAPAGKDLTDPRKKDIAMQLVSSAENSSLDWKAQYKYIEDIGDGRGYTAGIIGFCSGTGDMLELVELYTQRVPGNVLAKYLPALRKVNGTSSHTGLDPNFVKDWRTAATDPQFTKAQDDERDRVYFNPSVQQAKADGLRALGQFIYYDAIVMHGPGNSAVSFGGIRKAALAKAKPPAQGGDEATYLHAFLDARVAAMKTEEAHSDTSRVDTAQRVFLNNRNFDLNPPLSWKVYGDPFTIPA
ncbi:chitosanase [Dactylosporangium sp. AC04546]|uniref:chitosanase n=1 Tax=Dactylosporangium sp. AC04546 TaxID=2862460 RepID=UPI0027E1B7C8|nr:chitosanase [Dactylosporangium sp. AC04546]WVK78287.1 chitosanase [Dactylosporangium sp. AC04546]